MHFLVTENMISVYLISIALIKSEYNLLKGRCIESELSVFTIYDWAISMFSLLIKVVQKDFYLVHQRLK